MFQDRDRGTSQLWPALSSGCTILHIEERCQLAFDRQIAVSLSNMQSVAPKIASLSRYLVDGTLEELIASEQWSLDKIGRYVRPGLAHFSLVLDAAPRSRGNQRFAEEAISIAC